MDGSFPVHTAKTRSCVEIVFRHNSIFLYVIVASENIIAE